MAYPLVWQNQPTSHQTIALSVAEFSPALSTFILMRDNAQTSPFISDKLQCQGIMAAQ
ncbi:hypothetical protein [Methylovulum psychrotolerans]|uniref:hypothetical protein n=1 Tax=Methylovulum psychrotolerans TaxID=1704499 RepID=UPI001B805B8D|nr:hypothetical protein [Methylovulum psychrotolerans]